MANRSLGEIKTKEEEDDDKEGVIEEIFAEEDEEEDYEEEQEAEEMEQDIEERKKKRVCPENDGDRKVAAASSTAMALQQQQQQQMQRCQADNCEADLGAAKKYHQRHKVCENHSKAALVLVAGVDQRYCQQCSRFHELSQFDGAKRSCRERLANHNERRRKIPSDQQTEDPSRIPVVLQVKGSFVEKTHSWKPQGHSQVIKIALPRNPAFKHFQIR